MDRGGGATGDKASGGEGAGGARWAEVVRGDGVVDGFELEVGRIWA